MCELIENANAESVDKYRIVARHILATRHRANCGINRMEFITLTTVPYLLPFVKAELGKLRKKFTCWKLHMCNGP